MNAMILETIRARMLGLGMQSEFVSAGCHGHAKND